GRGDAARRDKDGSGGLSRGNEDAVRHGDQRSVAALQPDGETVLRCGRGECYGEQGLLSARQIDRRGGGIHHSIVVDLQLIDGAVLRSVLRGPPSGIVATGRAQVARKGFVDIVDGDTAPTSTGSGPAAIIRVAVASQRIDRSSPFPVGRAD